MPAQPCKGGCGNVATRHSKSGYCTKCYNRQGGDVTHTNTIDVNGDKATQTVVSDQHVRTLDDLIRVCEINTEEWEIERWVANKWDMGSKDDKGNARTTPLFQIKVWLKRNKGVMDAKKQIADMKADAKQIAYRVEWYDPKVPKKAKHMLEIAVPDLHLGKLAWEPETGYADYDLKIAEKLFEDAVDSLVARTSSFTFNQIVLPIGNDFLHSDTKKSTTTAGTPLDTDSRYHKSFLTGRRLLTRTIERLAGIAPVRVVVIPGNHDSLAAFHLGDALECWFHQNPYVEVMNEPIPRKYFRYGATALMWTHGDKGKPADFPLLFATEQPEMFAAAKYREIHCGHLHQTRLTEKMGVRVRISPALCSPDEWHAANHYVGNQRGAEALVYHEDEGLVTVAHYTVQEKK